MDRSTSPNLPRVEKTLTVFIVDDMPSARAGLSAFLNSLDNIEVVGSAADGVEAVERISTELPGVAIMDIEMPRMNGLEAIRQLRANGITIPIIALSIGWEYRDPALAAGASAFLYKGAPLTELITLLEGFRHTDAKAEQSPARSEAKAEHAPGSSDNPPITIIELETAYGLMHLDYE